MDIQYSDQPVAQPVQPAAVNQASEQPVKKSPLMKIILIVLGVIIVGGGVYAAYFYQVWPFSIWGLDKETALIQALDKMADMSSGRYGISMTATSEDREAGRPNLYDTFFAEQEALNEKYDRDNDRLRSLQIVLSDLENYFQDNNAYPSQLAGNISGEISQSITYQLSDNGSDFTLDITFELEEAVQEVKDHLPSAQSRDLTVSMTKSSLTQGGFYYFYLYQPRSIGESILTEGLESMSYIAPGDFVLTLNASGLTLKDQESTNADFSLGGEFSSGDLTVAAAADLRKIDDAFYGRITKMPGLIATINKIKGQWVKITKDDLVSSYNYSPVKYLEKTSDKSKGINKQIFELLKLAMDKKVFSIDYTLPDKLINEQEHYVYEIKFDRNQVTDFYTAAVSQLFKNYGDDAILKENEKATKFLASTEFQKLMDYLDANAEFIIAVNKKSGYLENFEYKFKLVPGGEGKSNDLQFALNFTVSLTDINQNLSVEMPAEFMTFEEAVISFGDMTKEEYRFDKQLKNIKALRRSLTSFKDYTGSYPATLADLEKSHSEFTKVEINMLEDIPCFGCTEPDLSKVPFINHVPNDVFSGQPLIYRLAADDYSLQYQMQLPPVNKDDGGYPEITTDEMLSVLAGINTANSSVLSAEVAAAIAVDDDGDSLPNFVEDYYGSDSNNADSDGDGFADGEEVYKSYDPNGPGKLNYYNKWNYISTIFKPKQVPKEPKSSVMPIQTGDSQVKGSVNAKVDIIVYTDFQCPFCKNYHETLKRISADYPDDVRIAYRHFPLASIHTLANQAAEASVCATEQGKFWEYADNLFANQSSFSDEYFGQAATALGLDKTSFDSCLSSHRYALAINTQYNDAIALGLQGTPASFINGEQINGAVSYETVKAKVDALLK